MELVKTKKKPTTENVECKKCGTSVGVWVEFAPKRSVRTGRIMRKGAQPRLICMTCYMLSSGKDILELGR